MRVDRRRVLLTWMWCPLLLTALIRGLWVDAFPVDPIESIDAEGFHLLAVNLLEGRGFAIAWGPPFCPNTVRTPLYPLFLAGIYRSLGRLPQAAVLIQVLLEVLTTAWVVALSKVVASAGCSSHRYRLGKVVPIAVVPLLAGLLYAVNGTTQRYTSHLLSEALLLPLLAAALYATIRLLRRPTLVCGVWAGTAWGLAVLTKPNVQFLALGAGSLVTARILWRSSGGHRRPPLVALWTTLCLVVLPWAIRNRIVAGRWMLSSAFEDNLARVSAVATQAALLGLDVEPWTETWEYLYRQLVATSGWDVSVENALSCEARLRQQRDIATTARTLVWANLGIYVRDHMRGTARSVLDPGHRVWYRMLTGDDWQVTDVVSDILGRMAWSMERGAVGDAVWAFWTERIARIPWDAAVLWWGLVGGRLAVVGLGVRGAWRLRERRMVVLLLLVAVLYQIVLPGPIAHDRFYVPAVPFVSVLVAHGAGGYNREHHHPRKDTTTSGGPND